MLADFLNKFMATLYESQFCQPNHQSTQMVALSSSSLPQACTDALWNWNGISRPSVLSLEHQSNKLAYLFKGIARNLKVFLPPVIQCIVI